MRVGIIADEPGRLARGRDLVRPGSSSHGPNSTNAKTIQVLWDGRMCAHGTHSRNVMGCDVCQEKSGKESPRLFNRVCQDILAPIDRRTFGLRWPRFPVQSRQLSRRELCFA